jgi:Tfp pilus assembly protein PilN
VINLLPPERKSDYRYARRNAGLLRFVAMFGVGLAGLAVICALGMLYLQQTARTYASETVAIEQSLKDQNQAEVEKEVKDISNSLKLAVRVLSEEVLFSQLLKRLAVTTPSNVSLASLSIIELKGGVDITAKTTDYNAATQLQVNLADPKNQIFAKADIVNISCITGSQGSKYPCTVEIRALFSDDNPFLFINDKAKN